MSRSQFGTIVLPLDGSQLAETALPYAAMLSRATGAGIRVVRVVDRLSENDGIEALQPAIDRLVQEGLSVESTVRAGEPYREIVDAASERDRPLIVLASHGRSGLGRVVVGSVAEQVIRASTCPVLIVRALEEASPANEPTISRITVPLDGSALSELSLPVALEVARAANARIHLVRVAQTYRDEVPEGPDRFLEPADYRAMLDDFRRLENETRTYLAGVVARLQGEGLPITWEALSGDPWRQLQRYIESDTPDLIVMTTHGRAGLARWVYGSISDRLITSIPDVPVLLIRSSEDED